jgi:hypothetical protein
MFVEGARAMKLNVKGSEVLTVVVITVVIFWDMAPCR